MTQSLYQDHFGIRENPFSIIPDPHYLYMSQRHQDALAHLLYGVSESGGFVLLTGEVGTGKTTICRALIEQLPENVDLALILNPRLSEIELMAAICDELRIAYPRGTRSLKAFFDFLNRKLLSAHALGRNPVLMIDEAQNLSPEGLELVRLLTNLETKDKKLLQIILVGQPELNHTLAQTAQRQTAQRITARFHLDPLGLVETRNYIHHRLHVAGLDQSVFTTGAIKTVYKAARGIPRLINSVCDRALLAAYVEGKKQVTRKLAGNAAAEVLGQQTLTTGRSVWGGLALALVLTGLVFWVGFDPYRTGIKETFVTLVEPLLPPKAAPSEVATNAKAEPDTPPTAIPSPHGEADIAAQTIPGTTGDAPAPSEPDAVAEAAPSAAPVPPAPLSTKPSEDAEDVSQSDGTVLDVLIENATPDRAFQGLFAIWGQSYVKLKGLTPCDKAQAAGLSCLQGETDLNGLKAMNRPVVVSFVMPDGEHVYGTVTAITRNETDGDIVTLQFERRTLEMRANAFALRWPGDYLVLWRPVDGIERSLAFGQQGEDVQLLRRLLAQGGHLDGPKDIDGSGSIFYGPNLRDTVRAFQESQGLRVDGIVGPETLLRITGIAGQTAHPVLKPVGPKAAPAATGN